MSTYSNLKFELIANGDQSGTWGGTTNVNIGTAIDEAITGSATVTFNGSDVTLSWIDTNGTQAARNLRLFLTGLSGGNRNLIVPAIEKQYIIYNDLTDSVTVKNATGTGVSIPPGSSGVVFNDGTNVGAVNSALPISSSLTLKLPTTDGTNGQALKTDGAGNLSFGPVDSLPSQTGNADLFLTTNGSTASWGVAGVKTVLVATTANITLSNTQNIDGISLVSGNRVLVKNQSTPASNGIYVVSSGAWSRSQDANSSIKISGSIVNVQAGSTNGGTQYTTTFKATDDIGVSNMTWNPVVTGSIVSGVTSFRTNMSGLTPSTDTGGAVVLSGTLGTANGGTGLTTVGTNGQVLTSNGTSLTWATPAAGGVSSITGTANQVIASASTGAVTLSLPQSIGTSSNVSFGTITGTTILATTVLRSSGDVVAFFSSDARLKENVVPIDNALHLLSQIRGVRYDWTDEAIEKKGGEDGYFVRKKDVGVIAQEVEAILPEIVAENPEGIKGVKYERLIALLIEAVKELKAEVDALKGAK